MRFTACLSALVLAGAPATIYAATPEQVLAEMNFARTAPQQYARMLASQLSERTGRSTASAVREAIRHLERMRPVAPLALSTGLSAAASMHVADTGPRGSRGHRGSNFSSPWSRMDRCGRRHGTAAENICYGRHDARSIVVAQIVDAGVRSRGHRKNILDGRFAMAGVSIGPHAGYRTMCVIDFAAFFVDHPRPGKALVAR